MTKDRIKEIIKAISNAETAELDKVDMMNELLENYNATDDIEAKLKESEDKYAALEKRYKDTFYAKLEDTSSKDNTTSETQEETEKTEEDATIEDVYKILDLI